MYRFDANGQLMMLELEAAEGTGAPPKRRPGKPDSELISIPYFHLDLVSGSVDLFGQRHWELRSPWRKGKRPLNTGAAPRIPIRVPLSGILEANPAQKYYLSKVACIGILRRAFERGKELPQKLERALRIQAGLMRPDGQPTGLEAYHINQRDEGIDLHGVSGALLATTNMQMQTFVTQPDEAVEGFDGYNGDLTGDVAATLGVNCGMSTGRNGIMAFAANQRDEVRDLRDVAGALQAQPGMKQQTFVAGFSAGAGASAGGIGYNESVAPTLKGSPGGNCMPSVLCLNDQGGSVMNCSENISGTLRAQEHGHQPLVYENHGIDSRYTGPHNVRTIWHGRQQRAAGRAGGGCHLHCRQYGRPAAAERRQRSWMSGRLGVYAHRHRPALHLCPSAGGCVQGRRGGQHAERTTVQRCHRPRLPAFCVWTISIRRLSRRRFNIACQRRRPWRRQRESRSCGNTGNTSTHSPSHAAGV